MTQIGTGRIGISTQGELRFLAMAPSLTSWIRIPTPKAHILRKGSVDDDTNIINVVI